METNKKLIRPMVTYGAGSWTLNKNIVKRQAVFGIKVLRRMLDGIQENENWRKRFNPYPTAFPYGNGMVLHFYQQQESSTTKTVHKVINKGLKTYV